MTSAHDFAQSPETIIGPDWCDVGLSQVTIDFLPDEVLLETFSHYVDRAEWVGAWYTMVHVCLRYDLSCSNQAVVCICKFSAQPEDLLGNHRTPGQPYSLSYRIVVSEPCQYMVSITSLILPHSGITIACITSNSGVFRTICWEHAPR